MPITSRFAAAAARAYGLFRTVAGGAAAAVDPFFNYVTALLHGDGTNGAQNNTFLDSSTNNFTITRNGNTTQGTFSPFSQTGWSNYFDGSGDYLSVASATALNLSTGDFTIECWVYPITGINDVDGLIGKRSLSTFSGGDWRIAYRSASTAFGIACGTNNTDRLTPAIALNQWNHIAFVRSSGTLSCYANGVRGDNLTWTDNLDNAESLRIGFNVATYDFPGYISNVRIVKGTAVYSGATYTVPTTPLTAITNTSLLTCQSNRFLDASSNNFTVTVTGDVSVQAFSPFNPTSAWSASSNGGSGYFDGSGDYLTVPDNAAFDFGSGDFTISAWVYPQGAGAIIDQGGGGASSNRSFEIYMSSASAISNAYISSDGNYNASYNLTGTTVPNAWNFVEFTRSSGTIRLFVNGTLQSSAAANFTIFNSTATVAIGNTSQNTVNPFTGYIADVRVLKGTGSASSTVPTAPLTAITNTSLLLNYTNAGIYDNAAVGDYETVGNAQVSTSVKKYGTGSMAFDGTGDYLVTNTLSTQPMAFGTGNFTIEFWLYVSALPSAGTYNVIYDSRPSGTNGLYPTITLKGSTLVYYTNTADQITSGSISATTWYHVALCRTASQTKLFINGTQVGATYADTNAYINATSRPLIGDSGSTPGSTNALNGYIDDLRVTKGVGRYQYNFTPPAAAFPNIGGTVTLTADPYYNYTTLLLPGNGTNGAQNNTFLDSSSNAFTITRNGNTTQGNFSPFSQTGWGNYFDGNGDYLITTSTQVIPTGSFTVEAFVYPTSSSDSYAVAQGTTGNAGRFSLGITSSLWYVQIGTAQVNAGSVALNQWTHLAATFNGTTLTLYVNGTSVGTAATTTNVQNTTLRIGSLGPADWGTFYWTGYISNTRSTNSVVYTSNFTPPTSALTAISGTTFLSCQSNRFIDNSTNAYAITRNGDVSVQAFSPFAPTAAWSASTNGGSGYFDGSGDYLSLADNAAFQYGTGDFTIEFWVYMSATAGSGNYYVLYDGRPSGTTGAYVNIAINNATPESYVSGSTVITGSALSANTWYHFAYARSGTSTKMFVNGTQVGSTYTDTTNYVNGTSRPVIGTNGFSVGTSNFNGYLSNYRVVKGTAVYTANFTPPTAPLTAVSGTSLLLSATNGAIVDATAKNDLETVGNAQISTTQSKFGGSSMYFDGTGDGLRQSVAPLWSFGIADFTIEAWVYPTAFAAGSSIITGQNQNSGTAGLSIALALNASGQPLVLAAASTGAYAVNFTGTALSLNTWTHVAVTRYGNTFTIWQNGISTATASSSVSISQDSTAGGYGGWNIGYSPISGQTLTGYIDDFRFTKGIARYTSNFTPPTSAFLLQ